MPANPNTDLLLITSAGGKQATALLPLLSSWKNIRLAVHTPASRARLQALHPHAETVATDLYSPSNCTSLLKDVSVAIHIGPSYHPHEASIGKMMVDAATNAHANGTGRLQHFILSSVFNTQLSKMLNHDSKREIEEHLIESGLPYTILQPSTFMDNLPVAHLASQPAPIFRAAWSVHVTFSWLALCDLAAAMKSVLEGREKHFYAQYPLASTHAPLSFSSALAILSDKIGKEVKIEVLSFGQAVDSLLIRLYGKIEGVDPRSKDAAQRMILYYDGRGMRGNSNVLEWLVGRPGVQFGEWVEGKVREGGK
ncbi:NAD(P)-binding protein [Melanomma pulvis-pyrius CBS 109.77]|uniref:NAD(P)-binding protein n=1 Tax=Melanomma pulvis-pyrius CBS 109.77 TaxID=1314802 RepID=A0A6A6WNT9_9PLEO|nr:NAD(P)-binding protein [Melanomma pulvis-pyrius CBS 109.77]